MFDELEIGTSSEPITGTVEAAPALLVTVAQDRVLNTFTEPKALDPLIDAIAKHVRAHTPDVTTAGGRAAIASLAFKVSRTKTYLDDLGKNLVAAMKELPKKVDANRLAMRTQLDALRDEARAPLDAWEAEQARVAAEEKAREEAAALLVQIERDHELALLMDAAFDRQAEDRKRLAEQARLEREEQIRKEAADKAREESQRREMDARLAQERAEREKAEAETRAKEADARAERERIAAAEREEQARIEATQAERRRQEAEAQRLRDEQAKREADQEHRRAFNRDAASDLVACGITEDQAKAVVVAILSGKVRHVAIAY